MVTNYMDLDKLRCFMNGFLTSQLSRPLVGMMHSRKLKNHINIVDKRAFEARIQG